MSEDDDIAIAVDRLVLQALRPGDADEMVDVLRDETRLRTISANVHPRHAASQKVASRAGLLPTNAILDGEQVWRRPATRHAQT